MSDEHQQRDRVERWIDLPASAAEVWAVIGDFGGVAAWHPAIDASEVVEIEGETYRHLTLSDGEKMLERLVSAEPRACRYEIAEGPLPVENYRSTLTVFDRPEGGCRVFWSSTFEADDPHADDLVAGIYEAGLSALRDRFGG